MRPFFGVSFSILERIWSLADQIECSIGFVVYLYGNLTNLTCSKCFAQYCASLVAAVLLLLSSSPLHVSSPKLTRDLWVQLTPI